MESRLSLNCRAARAAFLACGLLALAGCVGTTQSGYTTTYDPYGYDQPAYGQPGYPTGQPVYANAAGQPVDAYGRPVAVYGQPVYAADDYVYYPDSEVYYSNGRREYLYRNGPNWVRSATAPRYMSSGVSVHLDFSDDPLRHHQDVVRRYPHGWRPQAGYGRDNRWRDRDRDGDRW